MSHFHSLHDIMVGIYFDTLSEHEMRKNMAVSYKKLFKLMIDKDLKKKDIIDKTGLSYSTLGKLEKGENVEVNVLEKICLTLDCSLDDIAEVHR